MLSEINIKVPIVKPTSDVYVMDNEEYIKLLNKENENLQEENIEFTNQNEVKPITRSKPSNKSKKQSSSK